MAADLRPLPDLAKVEAEEALHAEAAQHDAETACRLLVEWEAKDRDLRRALDDARCSLASEVAMHLDGVDRLHWLKRASAKERGALSAWLEHLERMPRVGES